MPASYVATAVTSNPETDVYATTLDVTQQHSILVYTHKTGMHAYSRYRVLHLVREILR